METIKIGFSQIFKVCLLGIFTLTSAGIAHAGPSKFFVEITNPESIPGVYQTGPGASLDRLYAEYNKWTDTFSFRYDFTSSTEAQLGDAYFKFTNDGLLPNGNKGTWIIPMYRVDAQTQTLRIQNTDADGNLKNFYDTTVDYSYDDATRKGSIAFQHSVSEVWDVFKDDLGASDNWTGGSFTDAFGIWSHVVDIDFYNVDPVTGEFITTVPFLDETWIAFDPLETANLEVNAVPEPSSIMLVLLGLLGCFYRQIFPGLGSLLQSKNRQYQAG